MLPARITVFLLLLSWCSLAPAESQNELTVLSSGNQRVALIELYTSEGCSSCPPADRWLSGLKDDGKLWKDYVPVAFHVDYWNYIGWKDRFSRREFSDRQRRYQDEGGTRVVYTPGLFRDGEDWRGWRYGETGIARDTDDAAAGELVVRIDTQSVTIEFNSMHPDPKRLTAHIALLGMNLETSVRAGENKGRRLSHDFVALGLTPVALRLGGATYRATAPLPVTNLDVQNLAVAVWVSAADTQAPLQAVGGYLPSPVM